MFTTIESQLVESRFVNPSRVVRFDAAYMLALQADADVDPAPHQTLIQIDDIEELAATAALLGDAAQIAVSPAFRKHNPGQAMRLLREVETARVDGDGQDLRDRLKHIPLALGALLPTPLALHDDDLPAGPIDQRYVHKKKSPIF